MEKTLDLKMPGVQELGKEELMEVDGGKGWVDLVWMFAEDIVDGYVDACVAVWNYHVENGGDDARIAIRLSH